MRGDDGFTIIEALTAMAILAVGLVCLFGAGADALNASTHINSIDRAVLLAQSKLEELSLNSAPLAAHDSGEFAGSGVHWKATARNLPSSQPPPERRVLQSVLLEIMWRDGVRQKSLTVETRHLGVVKP